MITDIIKLKMPHVNSSNSFNILLHVTILFLILSLFFRFYICGITTKMINKEIDHIISDGVKSSSGKLDEVKSKINNYKQVKDDLLKQFNMIQDVEQKKEIKNKIAGVKNIMNNLKMLVPQLSETTNKTMFNLDTMNNFVNKVKGNFSYDYYVKLFSNQDETRKEINKLRICLIVIEKRKHVIYLVILRFSHCISCEYD
jgi:hypothetical protein